MDMSIHVHLATPEAGAEPGRALRDCLVANYQRLHRRLQRHLGCADRASDCLHDAWLRLGDMAVLPAVQAPEAYVYRVACNVALDRLRGERASFQVQEPELEAFADPSPGPEAVAEARSELRALERAMQRLPRRHRAVLEALRIEEMTRQEVARRYQLSLRNVDTALRLALRHCAPCAAVD